MKTLLYSVALVLNYVLPLGAQILDKRRLNSRQRARSWNTASWGSALYVAGPASMIAWVWVTRNEWARWRCHGLGNALKWTALTLAIGLGAAAVLFGISLVVLNGLAAVLGVPDLD